MNLTFRKKKVFFSTAFFVICALFSINLMSQGYSGVFAPSRSKSPLINLYNNPVFLVGNSANHSFSVLSGELNMFSNYFTLNNFFGLAMVNPSDSFYENIKNIKRNIKPDVTYPVNYGRSYDLMLFGYYGKFLIPNKRSSSVAVFARHRSISNFSNFNRNFFQLYDRALSNSSNINLLVDRVKNYDFSMTNLNYTHHSFAELGVSFATEILSSTKYIISGGITLKRTLGIDFRGLKTNDLRLRFEGPPYINGYRLKVDGGDLEFAKLSDEQRNKFTGFEKLFPFKNVFNSDASGWGMDLGFSYTSLKVNKSSSSVNIDSLSGEQTKPDCYKGYNYKFSVSLVDWGYVQYSRKYSEIRRLSIVNSAYVNDWNVNFFDKFTSFASATGAINDDLFDRGDNNDFVYDVYRNLFVSLPVKLHVDLDFPFSLKNRGSIWKNIFVNVAYNRNLNLIFENGYGNTMFSNFVLSPRYESPRFELSIPVTTFTEVLPRVPVFNLGLGVRYRFFDNLDLYLGTNNLSSMIYIPESQSANVYAGLSYSFVDNDCVNPKIQEEDSISDFLKYDYLDDDKDKVPNNKDKCPSIFGAVGNFGCPVDSEYVLNSKLKRLISGLRFRTNLPLLQPSSKKVLDSLTVLLKQNPSIKLLVYGKADSFNLSKYEFNDKLALQRDSVLRHQFSARGANANQLRHVAVRPEQPSPAKLSIVQKFYSGRDEDRDGVWDSVDRCPTLIGEYLLDGCIVSQNENLFSNTTILGTRIAFWKGLKDFAYESEKYLEDVAQIMKKDKDVVILVRAFVGKEVLTQEFKYELSQKRADNVKDKLVSKGIAPWRVIALGLSPVEPYNSVPMLMSIFDKKNLDTDFDNILDTVDRCPTLRGLDKLDGCPEEKTVNILRYIDSLSSQISFLEGGDVITPKSAEILLKLHDFLIDNPDIVLAISPAVVSTDIINEYKDNLSNMRANSLKRYLENLGVPPSSLIARGLGHNQPAEAVRLFTVVDSRLLDSDLDEVKDYEDKCPTVKGTVNYYGCPQISDEDLDFLSRMNRNIVFDPNKVSLISSSTLYLDSIVHFLNDNPNINIVTSGNVANAGLNPEIQDSINQERAEVIKNYLISKGIDKEKIRAVGLSYLEKKPWLTPCVRINQSITDFDADLTRDFYDKCPTTVGSEFNYGCPLESNDLRHIISDLNKKLLFGVDEYAVDDKIGKYFDPLIKFLEKNKNLVIVVSGHSDTTGNLKHNLDLSLNRAKAVKRYILQNGRNISPSRIITIGVGDKFPVSSNSNLVGREKNRRAEIYTVE